MARQSKTMADFDCPIGCDDSLRAGVSQYDTGTITGTVVDPQGAAVPKASVRVMNMSTGRVYLEKTDDQGVYVVPALPEGTYEVRAEKSGFDTGIVSDRFPEADTEEAFRQ